jgi:hypothetical protein
VSKLAAIIADRGTRHNGEVFLQGWITKKLVDSVDNGSNAGKEPSTAEPQQKNLKFEILDFEIKNNAKARPDSA